jgi:hypothetical protein
MLVCVGNSRNLASQKKSVTHTFNEKKTFFLHTI